jgi:hypothetical protein
MCCIHVLHGPVRQGCEREPTNQARGSGIPCSCGELENALAERNQSMNKKLTQGTSRAQRRSRRRRGPVALVSLLAMAAVLAIGAANAMAAPPTVVTEAPAPNKNFAVLKGSVNPNGLATTDSFHLGLTTAYGTVIGAASAGSGSSPVKISSNTGLLLENTVYHYQVVAVNKDGTSYGKDETFKTGDIPPSWSLQTIANPTNGKTSEMNDVSCLSGGECFAVGYSKDTSGIESSVFSRWTGSAWSTPTLSGGGHLESVSCTSTTACSAVGYVFDKAQAKRWNGTSWNGEVITGSRLRGVSCVSATECIAVGGTSLPLAERWNGTEWTALSIAGFGYLEDVSCVSASFCMAVGESGGSPATFTWNGTKWSTVKAPAGAMLSGVSCTAVNACTAVGIRSWGASPGSAIAARWNGTEWSVQETPLPAELKGTWLKGVSCTSSTVCVGVGVSLSNAGALTTLVERWNGAYWAIQSSPNPAGATSSTLWDVSCISSLVCESVGSYEAEGKTLLLAERSS